MRKSTLWAGTVLLTLDAVAVELGTRQQTIIPRDIPADAPHLCSSNVDQYVSSGYGTYAMGPGTNQGVLLDLMPSGYVPTNHASRLLSFFAISDIHITDKESPIQVPYVGWESGWHNAGPGGLNQSAYSPVMLSTTHLLDAAIRTANSLNKIMVFDFGLSLGDVCNSGQYNELRWFIDVMDGQWIRPSSGVHLGETSIDYQMPYQAAGLDPAISWYEVIGNHDQFWMGIGYPTTKVQQAAVGGTVLEISTNGPLTYAASEGTGQYVGVVDGSSPFGSVINYGLTHSFSSPPTVAPDTARHLLTTDITSPTNYTSAFFNSMTLPAGHGFKPGASGPLAACYSFTPAPNIPLKVIVLDDTCKADVTNQFPTFYGGGWVDAVRYHWLTNELQAGQDANQLMIIACHIPIAPGAGVYSPSGTAAQFYPASTNQTDASMVATMHNYPNLLFIIAGHRHGNTVTPFPDPIHPENGFWEIETPSLRDFPQEFRTVELYANTDGTVSIVTTDVDSLVQTNTPAGKSRQYAIGAARIYNLTAATNSPSYTFNAELIKPLTPAMQAALRGCGKPLGHRVSLLGNGTKGDISFLGRLEATGQLGDSWDEVPGATNSPHSTSLDGGAQFFRSVEP